jgi:hypothetical protein
MEEKRFTLRMDGALFSRISEMAEENRRSVAKEIEKAVSVYLDGSATERLWARVIASMSDENINEMIWKIRNDDEFKKNPLTETIAQYFTGHDRVEFEDLTPTEVDKIAEFAAFVKSQRGG